MQSIRRSRFPHTQLTRFKGNKYKKLCTKADTLVDSILSCPRMKLYLIQFLDVVETAVFLANFAQQLRGKNTDVPHIYFTLIDASGISPSLVLNQNTTAEER